MPISTRENHRPPPPQHVTRGQRKLLLFFLKCIIMVVVIFIFLFFLGFAAIVLLHFLFLSNTFNRRCTRLFQSNTAATSASEDFPNLLPAVVYVPAVFPLRSDCAICLDSFQEGDECRNLPICRHLFHANCVDRWIGQKRTCPVCRARIDFYPVELPDSRSNGY